MQFVHNIGVAVYNAVTFPVLLRPSLTCFEFASPLCAQYCKKSTVDAILRVLNPLTVAMLSATVNDMKRLAVHCFDGYASSSYHVRSALALLSLMPTWSYCCGSSVLLNCCGVCLFVPCDVLVMCRVQLMKLFDLCINVRTDLSKAERQMLGDACRVAVIASGFPPDDDELQEFVDPDVFTLWNSGTALPRILHVAFPAARAEATAFL